MSGQFIELIKVYKRETKAWWHSGWEAPGKGPLGENPPPPVRCHFFLVSWRKELLMRQSSGNKSHPGNKEHADMTKHSHTYMHAYQCVHTPALVWFLGSLFCITSCCVDLCVFGWIWMNCAEFIIVLSVGVKHVDIPNFNQRGEVSLQIRIRQYKEAPPYKNSSELSLALLSWRRTQNLRENADGGPQQESSCEALRFCCAPAPPSPPPQWSIAGSGVKLIKEVTFLLLIVTIKDKSLFIGPRVSLAIQYYHQGTRLFAFFIPLVLSFLACVLKLMASWLQYSCHCSLTQEHVRKGGKGAKEFSPCDALLSWRKNFPRNHSRFPTVSHRETGEDRRSWALGSHTGSSTYYLCEPGKVLCLYFNGHKIITIIVPIS